MMDTQVFREFCAPACKLATCELTQIPGVGARAKGKLQYRGMKTALQMFGKYLLMGDDEFTEYLLNEVGLASQHVMGDNGVMVAFGVKKSQLFE